MKIRIHPSTDWIIHLVRHHHSTAHKNTWPLEKNTSIMNLDENIEFHPWTSIDRLIIHPERLDSSVGNMWLPESFLRSVSRKTFALSSSSSSSSVLLQRSTETEKRSCIFSRKRRVVFLLYCILFSRFSGGFWLSFFPPALPRDLIIVSCEEDWNVQNFPNDEALVNRVDRPCFFYASSVI